MKKNRMHELGKSRVVQIRPADVCISSLLGLFAVWGIWISSSLLISFIR
jgi:hypothetical protein